MSRSRPSATADSLRLTQARAKLAVTQERAAEILRVHKRTYQAWEAGESPIASRVLEYFELVADGKVRAA